jgi:hypothetical protein
MLNILFRGYKMKVRLTLILVLVSVFSFAQDNHQEFRYDCSLCHSCENPTKLNPCLKACPRMEIITVHHNAEEGPDHIILDRFKDIKDNFPPILFSHKAHAEMSNMAGGCEMCHHYNPPGRIVPCSECHEASRIRTDLRIPDLKAAFHRQCIDCHQLWASNVECSDCHYDSDVAQKELDSYAGGIVNAHSEIETPARVVYETEEIDGYVTFYHSDHINIFGNECVDCHQQESCGNCHTEESVLKNLKLSIEEKHLGCSDCHDVDDNCESCHKEEIASGFNHAVSTGFNINKYHKKVDCQSCHKVTKSFKGLSGECYSCHKDWTSENFNHAITGLYLDENHIENDCEDCHVDNNYQKPTCDNCHDEDIIYPDYLPGNKK